MEAKRDVVLVTGGRDFTDKELIHRTLWAMKGMQMLIHGGASGVDRICGDWAASNGVHVAEVRALWDWFGKSAGPRRNDAMTLLRPDLLLAFPGSRGTAHMVSVAKRECIPIQFVSA